MRQFLTYGSVRGAACKGGSYRNISEDRSRLQVVPKETGEPESSCAVGTRTFSEHVGRSGESTAEKRTCHPARWQLMHS